MPCPSTPSRPDRLGLSSHQGRWRWRVSWVLALGLLVLVGGPRLATSAEPESEQKARALYQAGNEAFSAGRYEEAYQQWEEGYRLSSRPLFLVNMAHAERRRGDLGKARVLYQKFLLVDPQSPLRAEVEAVIAEINAVLPAETSPPAPPAEAPSAGATAAPAAGVDLTPPPVAENTPRTPVMDIGAAAATAPAETPPPFYRRWWFWTGVGAVVVGAVAVGLLAGGQDGPPRHGTLGTLGAAP